MQRMNERPMRNLGVSRRELFEKIERAALIGLPAEDWEFAEWRRARVNLDYHNETDIEVASRRPTSSGCGATSHRLHNLLTARVATLAPAFSALEADVAAQLAPVRGTARKVGRTPIKCRATRPLRFASSLSSPIVSKAPDSSVSIAHQLLVLIGGAGRIGGPSP